MISRASSGEVAALPEAYAAGRESVGMGVGRPAHPEPDYDPPFRVYVQRCKLLGQHDGFLNGSSTAPAPTVMLLLWCTRALMVIMMSPAGTSFTRASGTHTESNSISSARCAKSGEEYVLDTAVVKSELWLCHM